MIKVSVVMPVYNSDKYLKDSINTILNQSMKDLELICIDDGSTDNSLKILKEFAKKDSRVKIFTQDHNGAGVARNYGITKCNGKYLSFMDSDDLLDLNAFQELWNISEEKKLDVAIFKAINFDDETGEIVHNVLLDMNRLSQYVGDYVFDINDIPQNLFFHFNTTPWCKFYNLDFVINSKSRFAEGIIFEDDKFSWEIIFNAKRIYFYEKYLYKRRLHSDSVMTSNDLRYVGTITIMNIITKLFIEYGFWEMHKTNLCNNKISLIFRRYNEIKDEYKETFYNEMKKDFEKLLNHEKYDEIMNILHSSNRRIFDTVINSSNFNDFQKRVPKLNK